MFSTASVCNCRHNSGKTYDVVLGAGQVVIGMEQGLIGMCVGEKRRLVIPPHLAYGEQGVGKTSSHRHTHFKYILIYSFEKYKYIHIHVK